MMDKIHGGPGLTRRRFLALGLGGLTATTVASLLAACGGGDPTPQAGTSATPNPAAAPGTAATPTGGYTYAPKTGKTREALVVGVQGLPGGMDPADELSNVGTRVTYNVYDTLIRRDFLDNNKLVPALARSWQRQGDTALELKLREGVTFHNGDPLTAADVKFTFDRITAPDSTALNVEK
jgi:peptide/nickel transport system substrate-binding protein